MHQGSTLCRKSIFSAQTHEINHLTKTGALMNFALLHVAQYVRVILLQKAENEYLLSSIDLTNSQARASTAHVACDQKWIAVVSSYAW